MHPTPTIATIQDLHEKATRLDAAALHRSCGEWQHKERWCQVYTIILIAEVAQRNLHLDQGYRYLGDYCQQYLGLSEGEAWTRVHIAKVSKKYPELLLAFGSGHISLTVAGMLARHLTSDNKDELLSRAAGKSKRFVEELLASYTGVAPQQRSSLRPQYLPVKHDSTAPSRCSPPGCTETAARAPQATAASKTGELPGFTLQHEHCSPSRQEQSQLVHQLRCTISDATKIKLFRLAEILGIVDPVGNLEQIITKAAEIALQTKDPALSRKRRKSAPHPVHPVSSSQIETPSVYANVPVPEKQDPAPGAKKRSRYISRDVKRILLRRAGYQCEFISAEGRRCCQKTALQLDHVISFSKGGSNQLDNLMVLCGGHNRRKFEREVTPQFGLFPPACTA